MDIVGNDRILRRFKTIKEFKTDLGESFTKEENKGDGSHPNMQMVFKVYDPFVKKYLNMYGNYIYKYGKIGRLGIYADHSMEDNILSFFEGEEIFDFPFDGRSDFRSFITEKIDEIMTKESVEEEVEQKQTIEKELFKPVLGKSASHSVEEQVVDTKKMSNDDLIRYLLEQRQKSDME